MEYYRVDLSNSDKLREYAEKGDNVGYARVLEGNNPPRILIELSRNGLIGLGTELIRLAHDYQEGWHEHIHPAEKGLISSSMGIFLHPESSEVIISCTEFGVINDYVESDKNDE